MVEGQGLGCLVAAKGVVAGGPDWVFRAVKMDGERLGSACPPASSTCARPMVMLPSAAPAPSGPRRFRGSGRDTVRSRPGRRGGHSRSSRLERRVVQAVRVACGLGGQLGRLPGQGQRQRFAGHGHDFQKAASSGPAISARAPIVPRRAERSGQPRVPPAQEAGIWTCWTNSWTKNGLPSDSRAMAWARAWVAGSRAPGRSAVSWLKASSCASGSVNGATTNSRCFHAWRRAFLGPAEGLQERDSIPPVRSDTSRAGEAWVGPAVAKPRPA